MKSKITYLFFKLLNRSGNMKSASSSSSSGCEKVTPTTGVISVSAYSSSEEADNKSKINSRMSCASDDSCAINELLEGRMDLKVTMPDMKDIIINIERRTPMMDLLVHLATQYRFNATNYKIVVCEHEFKANTPIGSLDVNQIAIVPKQTKNMTLIRQTSSIQTPFQTFRLQVHLSRNQLMVIRVTPKDNIAAIKTIICNEKNLDPNKYQLVKIVGTQPPQILDTEKTLAFYGGLNEVTLLSNKSLSQLEMQYGSASTSSQIEFNHDKFLTSTPTSSSNYKVQNFSHSTPDISKIAEDKEKLKSIKKRPAPKPPSTPSIENHESIHLAISNENIMTESETNKLQIEMNEKNDQSKAYESKTYEEKLIKNAISEPIIIKLNEQNVKVMKSGNANHVRQNSGSDSSGYHESVLSSDSPESSSAGGPAQASSSSTNTTLTNNKHQSNKTHTGTNNGKKRRAPPPPSQHQISIKGQQENDDKQKNIKNVSDAKADKMITSIDCMSDVSIPISTSSASSSGAASASSINNRSLSPIVITQNRSLKSNNNNNQTRSLPSMGSIQSTMTPSPVTSEHSELENELPQPQQPLVEKVELIEKETETINISTAKNSNQMEQQQVSFIM